MCSVNHNSPIAVVVDMFKETFAERKRAWLVRSRRKTSSHSSRNALCIASRQSHLGHVIVTSGALEEAAIGQSKLCSSDHRVRLS